MPLLIILMSLIILIINHQPTKSTQLNPEQNLTTVVSKICEQRQCDKQLVDCSKKMQSLCKEILSENSLKPKDLKTNKTNLNYP